MMKYVIFCVVHNVRSLCLVADDSRPKPNKNTLIIKFKNNMDKNKTIPTLSKTAVSSCFSIDDKKPKKGQEIMYKGNLGFSKGTYRNFDKNIGWVILPDGGIDCFDEWCLK